MVAKPSYYRKRVRALEAVKEEMDIAIRNILRDVMDGDISVDHVVSPQWDCDESPVGLCVYDTYRDQAKDQCIFCGDPLERK